MQIGEIIQQNRYKVVDTNEGHKTASDLIIATSQLIGEPIGKMFSLTKGWSVDRLDRYYRDCQKDGDPKIAWWKMRKREK